MEFIARKQLKNRDINRAAAPNIDFLKKEVCKMGRRKKTLREKALDTSSYLGSCIDAREDDLNRDLTDQEVLEEAKYKLECLPYTGRPEDEIKQDMKELKAIIREGEKRGIKCRKLIWLD